MKIHYCISQYVERFENVGNTVITNKKMSKNDQKKRLRSAECVGDFCDHFRKTLRIVKARTNPPFARSHLRIEGLKLVYEQV